MDQARKDIYINLIKTAIGDENLTSFAARAGLSAGNLSRLQKTLYLIHNHNFVQYELKPGQNIYPLS